MRNHQISCCATTSLCNWTSSILSEDFASRGRGEMAFVGVAGKLVVSEVICGSSWFVFWVLGSCWLCNYPHCPAR